jgi:3-dehydroquinate synthase
VDSSVGGKTAINHRDGTNLIGAFYQPKLVLIDVALLRTLPRRELIAGLAEVIKYGIIQDPALFALLERYMEKLIARDSELLTEVIADSCAIKARVVETDEREDGYRAVLNFGHTIGHALEAATGYKKFLHGEAIGVGMAKAARRCPRGRVCATRRSSSASFDSSREPGCRQKFPKTFPCRV